ncbi:MAG: helix-turn-helix transcriptional regulator [Candidatus Melainabacteria bacterium]|nr:helix-turn-helix transcriptional regulator [Candidatus Melainabacteria bacterium]
MNKITQLLPNNMPLKDTLAGRINQLREFRNMTVKDLARATRMTVQRIEDLEAGFETWLSATDRQVIAKALRVEAYVLREVEVRLPEAVPELTEVSRETMEELADNILHGERNLNCPRCQSPMTCYVQEAIDLEDNKIFLPMASCTKCPFVLK